MKLKPCPFCGGEAVTYSSDIDMYGNLMYGAMCKHTGCGVISCVYPSKEQAIEAWNRREPMDKIVEQLIANSGIVEDGDGHAGHFVFTETAIEIVKSGGKM